MELKDLRDMLYNQLEFVYNRTFEKGEQNSQDFLNWLDKINKLSTQW